MKKLTLLLLYMVVAAVLGQAQDTAPQVSTKYLIKNAIVVTKPGMQSPMTSVLINDGIIERVGTNITAPYDAVVIDADSMYVYPAFIGGISHVAIKEDKDEKSKEPIVVASPPNDIAGITPERSVAEVYSPSDSKIKGFREAGFAAVHTVPTGKMLPGAGSVISLSGKDYHEAALRPDMSVLLQMKGSGRMFPSTTIGVMAKWRELYRNAEINKNFADGYARNSRGKKRPQADEAVKGLYGVVAKQTPVYATTSSLLDVHRSLQMQKEMGYDLTLANIKDGNRAADKIKSARASVVLSLDLPDEIKEDKDHDEITAEVKELNAKKKEAIADRVMQSKVFADKGIPFSYSLIKVKGKDVLPAVRRAVAAGLSHEAALTALTTTPATQLGISDRLGSIENGKVASLFIATDSIFTDDAQIKTVFVDGIKHDIKIKEKKKKTDGAGEDVDMASLMGEWKYEMEIPGMSPAGTMTLSKSGDDVKVVLTNDQAEGQEITAENVEFNGGNMTMDYTINTQGMSIKIESNINFEGDSFEGTVDIAGFGNFAVTGSKVSNPE